MDLVINGQTRSFPGLSAGATLIDLLTALGLQQDRVAVEHNGSIVSRPAWPATAIAEGDRFEIVHFVGGGSADWQAITIRSCDDPSGTEHHSLYPQTTLKYSGGHP